MDTVEAMFARHTVRDFRNEPVDKETIIKILEAANRSPSSGNSQPWQLFVVGGDALEKIRQSYIERFRESGFGQPEVAGPSDWPAAMQERGRQMREERRELQNIDPEDKEAMRANIENYARLCGAPVFIVVCMDKTLKSWSFLGLGLLIQSILLAAKNYGIDSLTSLGLVSNPDILRKELAIPDDLMIVIGVALGYPNEENILNTYRSSRRPIEEVASFKGI